MKQVQIGTYAPELSWSQWTMGGSSHPSQLYRAQWPPGAALGVYWAGGGAAPMQVYPPSLVPPRLPCERGRTFPGTAVGWSVPGSLCGNVIPVPQHRGGTWKR